ncbi:hypothetical protein Cgig2_002652 [Carnegiea gigantea]|uniref:Uncharacterized protein n=1 Tax=Carnegiea gigantea TaxID=171969 RepID=A0A9Q1GRP7_9CARY|nr:hypothetical protein Cgig2_002652 [Carnegiea gigantea]
MQPKNAKVQWLWAGLKHFTLTEDVGSSVLVGVLVGVLLSGIKSSFYQDIPTDIDFSILRSSKIMLRLHQACVCYETNSQVLFPGQCPSLERKFTSCFQEWWSKVGNSRRKRDDSSDQTIQRDEGPSGSKPKLKIVHSEKPLRPPILVIENNTSQTKIP